MDVFMRNFFDNIMAVYGIALGYSVLILIFRIMFMLAIGFDCKARGNKKQTMWMLLTFFFPLVAGIVYACKRDNAPVVQRRCDNCGTYVNDTAEFCPNCGNHIMGSPVRDAEKNQRNSYITFGVSIVSLVVAVILYAVLIITAVNTVFDTTYDALNMFENHYNDSFFEQFDDDWDQGEIHYGYSEDGVTVYYDKNGKAYHDEQDVLYYDKDGNTYTYDDYEFETKDNIELDSCYCYVDENGYFYFDKDGYRDERKSTVSYSAEYDCFLDDNGVKYFFADSVSWDKNGNLVDYWGDYLIDNNGN